MTTPIEKLHFTSDYMTGAHPRIIQKLMDTNMYATQGYGDDEFTTSAEQKILKACNCPNGEVKFLVGGTQTNATVIDCILKPYQGVIAANTGHIATHEAGAIEYGGHKVLSVPHQQGKISATDIESIMQEYQSDLNKNHTVMPGMVYISHPTEFGTLYTKKELLSLSTVCHKYHLPLYVDGARLAYALGSPDNEITLSDLSKLADIFYIGGTKCGTLFGEAVVLTQKNMIPHFFTMIKQHGALLAKGRLLGIQFDTLFTNNLYETIGQNAVSYGQQIKETLINSQFTVPFDSPTNQIFFVIENNLLAHLAEQVEFGFMQKWSDSESLIRLCTSWSTTEEDTNKLLQIVRNLK